MMLVDGPGVLGTIDIGVGSNDGAVVVVVVVVMVVVGALVCDVTLT